MSGIKQFFHVLRQRRGVVQGIATLLANVHLPNFFRGTIYQGPLKKVCVPGLNCYSCPGATGACPIGSFQAVVGSSPYSFSYYVTGLLILFGVLLGRLVCGFLCPFGWFQDLLHRIPTKKFSTECFKPLRYVKYVVLVLVVWLMGVWLADTNGLADPYFCKYICPQGILEGGIPLSLANTSIRAAGGFLFRWKLLILVVISVMAIFWYRPFCKWLCPLGAFYALFNRVSFYQYHVDQSLCIQCGKCRRTCKMDVDIVKEQAACECIRCGDCIEICPVNAISTSWRGEKQRIGKGFDA